MQKIRKILRAVFEKTALPTNYYQQHQFFRTWLTPFQQELCCICKNKLNSDIKTHWKVRYNDNYTEKYRGPGYLIHKSRYKNTNQILVVLRSASKYDYHLIS